MLIDRRIFGLMAMAGAAAGPAFAQRQAPQPPPSPQFAALAEIANALGMLRGTQRQWKSVNRIYYIAAGSISVAGAGRSWSDYKLARGMFEMNYAMPAVRVDLARADAKGKADRTIEVARGDVAWNETAPGVGASSAPGAAADRRWLIYTTPHGVVRAAMEAALKDPASVVIDGKGFRFPSPEGQASVSFDAAKRPSRIEIAVSHPVLGATTVATELSDYRDWEKLGVWFPARIVQTIGGRRTQDLRVSEFRTNPYVIFPVPEGLG
jgi:hypothetical protein